MQFALEPDLLRALNRDARRAMRSKRWSRNFR
jgi:hypothetical protein